MTIVVLMNNNKQIFKKNEKITHCGWKQGYKVLIFGVYNTRILIMSKNN